MLERDPEFYQSKCFVFEGVVYTADFSLIDTTFVIDWDEKRMFVSIPDVKK